MTIVWFRVGSAWKAAVVASRRLVLWAWQADGGTRAWLLWCECDALACGHASTIETAQRAAEIELARAWWANPPRRKERRAPMAARPRDRSSRHRGSPRRSARWRQSSIEGAWCGR
jgi:hypothetical protein